MHAGRRLAAAHSADVRAVIVARAFLTALQAVGVRFFTGVPDSTLKAFCRVLEADIPSDRHVVAANEGTAVALAAGHYLATGAVGCVYMQNSGLGNAANPLISLNAPEVYGIPVLLVVGWRGEMADGVQLRDEPQHAMQGRITLSMLDGLEIEHVVLGPRDSDPEGMIRDLVERGRSRSRPVALVVRRGLLDGAGPRTPITVAEPAVTREAAVAQALDALPPEALCVATTGKVARELYAYRQRHGTDPRRDFLMVGSMGHAVQIAAGVALARPDRQVVCIDGDGAMIMHMGGLTTSAIVPNLLHLVMNNGTHESTGGAASRGFAIDMPGIARACGYAFAARVDSLGEVAPTVRRALKTSGASFLEIRVAARSRPDLPRPEGTPADAKRIFMARLLGDAVA